MPAGQSVCGSGRESDGEPRRSPLHDERPVVLHGERRRLLGLRGEVPEVAEVVEIGQRWASFGSARSKPSRASISFEVIIGSVVWRLSA